MNPHPKLHDDRHAQPLAFSAPAASYPAISLRSAAIQRIQQQQQQLRQNPPQPHPQPPPPQEDRSPQESFRNIDKNQASEDRVKVNKRSQPTHHSEKKDSQKTSGPSTHRPFLPRSPSIPIATKGSAASAHAAGLKRTSSELRLQEEEELADFRDYMFFTRLVEGISKRKELHNSAPSRKHATLQHQNDLCLARIIGTRNGSLDRQARHSFPSNVFPNPQHNGSWGQHCQDLEESLSSSLAAASSSSSTAGEEIFVLDW